MAIVGTFPFNAFLSGVLSCIGTSVLGGIASNLVPCLSDLLMFTRTNLRHLFVGTCEVVSFQVHMQREATCISRNVYCAFISSLGS